MLQKMSLLTFRKVSLNNRFRQFLLKIVLQWDIPIHIHIANYVLNICTLITTFSNLVWFEIPMKRGRQFVLNCGFQPRSDKLAEHFHYQAHHNHGPQNQQSIIPDIWRRLHSLCGDVYNCLKWSSSAAGESALYKKPYGMTTPLSHRADAWQYHAQNQITLSS